MPRPAHGQLAQVNLIGIHRNGIVHGVAQDCTRVRVVPEPLVSVGDGVLRAPYRRSRVASPVDWHERETHLVGAEGRGGLAHDGA